MKIAKNRVLAFFPFLLFIVVPAQAEPLTVTITKWVEDSYPIAVVPFAFDGKDKPELDVVSVINRDLLHSGKFNPYPVESYLSIPDLEVNKPESMQDINFKGWRIVGQESLVTGSIKQIANDNYEISFYLYDVFKNKQVWGKKATSSRKQLRSTAHVIADILYKTLTGKEGAFSTYIAFVTKDVKGDEDDYVLWYSDWDGENRHQIRRSKYPFMSPSWSPDGKQIAYASLEQGGSQKVFVEDWRKHRRTIITTTHKGLYGAPAWSHDGKYLAFAISRHGNADIYRFDLASKRSKKLTTHWAIDTEPVWSHDDSHIIFTSDRSGRPQIYSVPSNGSGGVKRLTFAGNENLKATVSPDGKSIAMVHQIRGQYKVATMNLKTGRITVLTDGRLDESPSFAPNGSILIYSTSIGERGTTLATISDDGGFEYVFNYSGDVREPAWSPLNVK